VSLKVLSGLPVEGDLEDDIFNLGEDMSQERGSGDRKDVPHSHRDRDRWKPTLLTVASEHF